MTYSQTSLAVAVVGGDNIRPIDHKKGHSCVLTDKRG